jgi:hypothetical protein
LNKSGLHRSITRVHTLNGDGRRASLMIDKNNLQLADILLKWIDKNAGK